MQRARLPFFASCSGVLVLLLSVLTLLSFAVAENSNQWVRFTESDGEQIWLAENRRPALYTQNFGDCMGNSLINVTRFDAAYYKDNMTVTFHLAGNTAVKNESLMMYIGVFAYGENRFELTFNPCNANIDSLCPMNASVPIEASGVIPVAQSDVAGIPPIALGIPDFEGQAILRIFANSTESQIGCYSAVVTNGASFSHPAAVGGALGVCTAVALFASTAVAIYGDSVASTRKHYAHSVSVLVVFSVYQHIFFTGALSMNWPSVLVAFWSNFAWSAGMIYNRSMQNSINQLMGSNTGNLSIVGAAATGESSTNLDGGVDISQIYKRTAPSPGLYHRGLSDILESEMRLKTRIYEGMIGKRDLENSSSGFSWYGNPVKPGLPLPGNFSGFAGTLSMENIPASNALMTGFLWYLILVGGIGISVVILKYSIEAMCRARIIKTERLAYFRAHWIHYMILAVLRTFYISFFMMMFLTMFQFTFKGSPGVTAIAAFVFVLFFVGIVSVTGYACIYQLRSGNYHSQPDRMNIERSKRLGFIPWYDFLRESQRSDKDASRLFTGSIPWWRVHQVADGSGRPLVDEDADYLKKFGWLTARFKASRWWFFAAWIGYEFIRACFFGGAAGHAMTQVFGLLAVEFIALVAMVIIKPFEGLRLNALMVYFLGFSKVTTVALSSAFDPRFNLNRITTTVIGIVIIVIQGVLTILLLIAIATGAISSYISISRNREDFKPNSWTPLRQRYIRHVENLPVARLPTPPPAPEVPKEPYFRVTSVKRLPKIEDEDDEKAVDTNESKTSVVENKGSRPGSLRSQISYSSLPFGARNTHRQRASWSSRDFALYKETLEEGEPSQVARNPLTVNSNDASSREGTRTRASSRAGVLTRAATLKIDASAEFVPQRSNTIN